MLASRNQTVTDEAEKSNVLPLEFSSLTRNVLQEKLGMINWRGHNLLTHPSFLILRASVAMAEAAQSLGIHWV